VTFSAEVQRAGELGTHSSCYLEQGVETLEGMVQAEEGHLIWVEEGD